MVTADLAESNGEPTGRFTINLHASCQPSKLEISTSTSPYGPYDYGCTFRSYDKKQRILDEC